MKFVHYASLQQDIPFEDFLNFLSDLPGRPDEMQLQAVCERFRRVHGEIEFLCRHLERLSEQNIETAFADSYSYSTTELGWYGQYSLRANIWQKRKPKNRFNELDEVYDLPHNHDFHLITKGIFGGGYLTDIFQFDHEALAGFIGEKMGLQEIGQFRLGQGDVIYYPQYNVVHIQHPPEDFSISLNIIPAFPVNYGQFIADTENDIIEGFAASKSARVLSLISHYVESASREESIGLIQEIFPLTGDKWLKTALVCLLIERFGEEAVRHHDIFKNNILYIQKHSIDVELFSFRHIKAVRFRGQRGATAMLRRG